MIDYRTLCRALSVATTNCCGNVQRSLYESFCLSFLTQLDKSSRIKVEKLISESLFEAKDHESVLKYQIERPRSSDAFECIEGFWIRRGNNAPFINKSYILTSSVKRNLKDLARIVSLGKGFPILLQGETSVGKTSMIQWLAQATGNVCVRVNNHEHTDLQVLYKRIIFENYIYFIMIYCFECRNILAVTVLMLLEK